MVTFNDEHNLTNEAERVVCRFIDNELQSVDWQLLHDAIGEDYEDWCELTPRTLVCDLCGEEYEDGADCDGMTAEEGESCPACTDINLAWNDEHDDEEAAGEDEPEVGTLEYREDDEHGGLPMWGTLWKCGSFLERKIRENVCVATDAGFSVYEYQDEIYLGVNGGGYGFYAAHFAPLYRNVFADSPVPNGGVLPGDPIYTCDTCGYAYTRDELPECPEGVTRPRADSFTRGPFTEDGGLHICDCTRCPADEQPGGSIVARPHVTFEQRRQEQRDLAVQLVRDFASLTGPDTEFSCGRIEPAMYQLVQKARAVIKLTEGA